MSCVYCTLPEIKAREIIGNKLAWAFPTNIPIVPGHVLVAPRRCIASYEEMTSDEKVAIEEIRMKIVRALTKAFGAQGFNFAWNQGKLAGQSVPHYHLHVLPRKDGDTGIYEYEPRKFLYRPGEREVSPEAELSAVAKFIRDAVV